MLVLYAEVLKMFNTTQIYNQYKYYQYIKDAEENYIF